MRIPFKLISTAASVCVAAAGFFNFKLPDSWEASVPYLNRFEEWMFVNVPHPALFMLGVGMFFGLVVVPSLLDFFRYHAIEHVPVPDIEAGDAFSYIMKKSKRAKHLSKNPSLMRPVLYEVGTPSEITEGRIQHQIVDELHDHLRQGRVTAWGTPDGRKPYQLINKEEWSDIEIMVDKISPTEIAKTKSGYALHATFRKNRGSTAFSYVWLKMDDHEIRRVYPKAFLPRRAVNISDTDPIGLPS